MTGRASADLDPQLQRAVGAGHHGPLPRAGGAGQEWSAGVDVDVPLASGKFSEQTTSKGLLPLSRSISPRQVGSTKSLSSLGRRAQLLGGIT
jgi:hypothetical protein